MKRVTKKEFYEFIGMGDVCCRCVSTKPLLGEFTERYSGRVVACYTSEGTPYPGEDEIYFIEETEKK